jgi:hypothetical protein
MAGKRRRPSWDSLLQYHPITGGTGNTRKLRHGFQFFAANASKAEKSRSVNCISGGIKAAFTSSAC